MKNEKKVFISWSGDKARELADFLYDWMPTIVQNIRPWASFRDSDLAVGHDDHGRIVEAARDSDICLSILSTEGLNSPWLMFEPGIFFGQKKEVVAMLCGGLSYKTLKQINYPLNGYHATPQTIDVLMRSINSKIQPTVDEKYFNDSLNEKKTQFITRHDEIFPNDERNATLEIANDARLMEAVRIIGND